MKVNSFYLMNVVKWMKIITIVFSETLKILIYLKQYTGLWKNMLHTIYFKKQFINHIINRRGQKSLIYSFGFQF